MVYVTGTVIATAVVAALAAGLALWSYFHDGNGTPPLPPLPPYSPPPAYDKNQRRRHRRSKSRSSNSSDHSSDSKGSYSSGFLSDEHSRANSVYSDSPKVKSDPVVSSRRPGSVDSNSSKSSSKSGSSSSKSKSRMRSRPAATLLDENSFPLVSGRPGPVDSNLTNSSCRSFSSSSKSKSRSGSAASSSSISKCESWSVTSEPQVDENGFPLCVRSDCCVTCEDKDSDVVTFLPCGGSYLCKKCAFKFLDIGDYCCKCGMEIDSVALKK